MNKTKLYSALFVLSLSISNLNAQAWVWATGVGGTSYDIANDIYTDASGNSYVTGWFQNTVNFGPNTLTSLGTYDFYVAKYNSSGTCLWAQGTGSSMNDVGYGVIADASGNVYVTGMFQGTVMFGTTSLTSTGFEDIFVAKYNSAGVCQWASSAGSNLDDQGQAIALDANGDIIVNGYFKNTATFGTNTVTSAGSADTYVAKINSAGVWQWVQKGGGTSGDNGYGVTTDASSNVYITGYFRNSATFGTFSLTSAGTDDVFIVKYNSAGVCQWAQKGGGTMDDHGNGIVSDQAGNLYLTGWFKGGACTFGTTNLTASGTNEEAFVAKYNSFGFEQWAVSAGSSSYDIGTGICLDNTNMPVISMSYQAAFTIGTNLIPSYGGQDIVVAKFNSASGTNMWAVSAGGTASDYAFKVSADATGNIYTAGNFNGTCNFGTNPLTSGGIADIFIAKIDPVLSGITSQENISEINLYPNPAIENVNVNASTKGGIILFNSLGEEIGKWNLETGNNEINISELSSGIYFYQIISEEKSVKSGKLVIQ